jgi:monofunctional biosynthetic peptidoglycan transglycosylase
VKRLLAESTRLLVMVLLCGLALQLFFLARVAWMAAVAPDSTSFQRSEAWRLLVEKHRIDWAQEWVSSDRLPNHLRRAVIASEDAGFTSHDGVDWAAIKNAWSRNQRAASRAAAAPTKSPATAPTAAPKQRSLRLIGGSTITQQLAKNLFLSGERTTLRKAQEIVITFMLEALLSKSRILDIYLNSVEWGEGVFGAQAASMHYFHMDAAKLSPLAAARLAVMLPAPKRFERQPTSGYILGRAAVIEARMPAVDIP